MRRLRKNWQDTYYVSDCHGDYLYQGTADGITPEPFCSFCNSVAYNVRAPWWLRVKLFVSDMWDAWTARYW